MCHKSSRHTQIGSLKENPTSRHDVKIVITVGTIKFKNHARGRQGEPPPCRNTLLASAGGAAPEAPQGAAHRVHSVRQRRQPSAQR